MMLLLLSSSLLLLLLLSILTISISKEEEQEQELITIPLKIFGQTLTLSFPPNKDDALLFANQFCKEKGFYIDIVIYTYNHH